MDQQLSLSARPKTLDQLIGQDVLVKRIRGLMKRRIMKAWMFTGPKGTGKTTLARILALSYQCKHGVFGVPCSACRKNRRSFDIHYINAAKITGIREVEQQLEGSNFAPRFGPFRIYIIDEMHRLTSQAQGLLLGYLEDDTPETTVFIVCSTEPHLILATIQSRCQVFALNEMQEEDTLRLVKRLLKTAESDLPADRLAMHLAEFGVGSPRLIAQAVDKYVAGAGPEEACAVMASQAINTKALTKAIIRGDWPSAAKFLEDMQFSQMEGVRGGSLKYLWKMLLHSPEISDRTGAIARAVDELVAIRPGPDVVQASAMTAAIYRVTAYFARYKG